MNVSKITIVLCSIVLLAGCVTIRGSSTQKQRNYVATMQELTLEELYELRLEAKQQVADSAGYAVFSNVTTHLFVLSTGSGYGVVTNNVTQKVTYMKMFGLGVGPGFGAKDYRVVIIFKKQEDVQRFANGSWDFSGQFDAVLKSQEKGGSIAGVDSLGADIITYQFTKAGMALQVSLQGAKFWRFHALN